MVEFCYSKCLGIGPMYLSFLFSGTEDKRCKSSLLPSENSQIEISKASKLKEQCFTWKDHCVCVHMGMCAHKLLHTLF